MSGQEIAEIVNVVNLYPVGVDTQQWSIFDRVFTTDVHADFGGLAVWDGLEPLKQAFDAIHAPFEATQHATQGHNVSVERDRASCFSYVFARFIRPLPEGGNTFESSGWYDDRLVRTADGWRISRRVCRMVWWGGNPAVLETVPGVKVEQVLDSPRAEARAGRIGHVQALLSKTC